MLWAIIESTNEVGWFSVGRSGGNVTGLLLWAFWLIEATVILGVTGYFSHHAFRKWVFCENCDVWCDENKNLLRLTVPPSVERLKSGDLEALAGQTRPGGTEVPYVRIDQSLCKKCGNVGTYCFTLVSPTLDKEGKMTEKQDELTGNILLDEKSAPLLGVLLANAQKTSVASEDVSTAQNVGDEPPSEAETTTEKNETAETGEATETNETEKP
jgi:hypothetical protein